MLKAFHRVGRRLGFLLSDSQLWIPKRWNLWVHKVKSLSCMIFLIKKRQSIWIKSWQVSEQRDKSLLKTVGTLGKGVNVTTITEIDIGIRAEKKIVTGCIRMIIRRRVLHICHLETVTHIQWWRRCSLNWSRGYKFNKVDLRRLRKIFHIFARKQNCMLLWLSNLSRNLIKCQQSLISTNWHVTLP